MQSCGLSVSYQRSKVNEEASNQSIVNYLEKRKEHMARWDDLGAAAPVMMSLMSLKKHDSDFRGYVNSPITTNNSRGCRFRDCAGDQASC